jgi:hypothetical protein
MIPAFLEGQIGMKRLYTLLLIGGAVLGSNGSNGQNAEPNKSPAPAAVTQADAIDREKQLFEADQKHDMDKINSIVADDFVDIARDGSSIGKQDLLKEIPTLTLLNYSQKNWDFDSMGPYAYSISYDSDATMIKDNKQARSQNHLNSVWIYRSARWQMLLHSRGDGNEAK